MNAKGLIIWGVTLVTIVAYLTFEKVNGQRDYHRGFETAMKEAYDFGYAEKLFHTEQGIIYSFLPPKPNE